MTSQEILTQLQEYGDAQTKSTHMRHGAKEPVFGVKVQHLKKILKATGKNHQLSLELYKTGNSDAMYLAGLMADEKKITQADLNSWVKKAYWPFLSECAVPWVAADTEFGLELGLEWIKSKQENVAAAGWSTLAGFTSVNLDDRKHIPLYKKLLDQVKEEIHGAQNRVRYAMNGFVISLGSNVKAMTKEAKEVADAIGKVSVNVGNTACKVPLASEYIDKAVAKGRVGKKRKTARC